uniref:Putative N-acetylmuramoyl-L-alanine amidase n=1 Tax=viral metagenome TaxID=1070528 RepID=A0A6H1ZZB5_9ZZZZ
MPKIYLSPSTQETNLCKMGDTEEMHCNKIADLMEPLLKHNGIDFTRNTPAMTHVTSKNESNKNKYDLHYALHSNAYNEQIEGSVIFYASEAGKYFAKVLAETYREIYPGNIEIRKPDKKYTELYQTFAPAVIDEIAFHDNVNDAKWIHDNLEAIAKNKVKALCKCFEIPYKEPKINVFDMFLDELETLINKYKELIK